MSEKVKKKRARKYVPRNTIQFQMDLRKKDDLEVLEIHKWATSSGKALQMFRDGYRLINALRQGDTSLLFSLFPDLDGSLTPHDENLLAEFRAALMPLTSKIDGLQQLPLPGMQPSGGLQPLQTSHVVEMPTFDDDEVIPITLVKNPKADEELALNFLKSAQGFNS